MTETRKLFTTAEMMELQAIVKRRLQAAAIVPLHAVVLGLSTVTLSIVAITEWEIIYQVFDYLAAESDAWSPELMSGTSLIMLIGFHLMGQTHPDNFAVRFLNKAVGILIPVYIIGVGLLVAAMLYADGLGDLINEQLPIILGDLPGQSANGSWLDALFSKLASPLAVAVFCLGLGGLAICNLFVAHHLLILIARKVHLCFRPLAELRTALADWREIKDAQKRFSEIEVQKMEQAVTESDLVLCQRITTDTLGTISQALEPHKAWLQEHSLRGTNRFTKEDDINPKKLAQDIAKIEAIGWDEIWAALHPKVLEKKS